jgi:type I restriction enzyme S subunit
MVYTGNYRLGDLFESRREKGSLGLPLLSVTLTNGMVNREELKRKQETELSDAEHLVVHRGDIAYNMMRMWQGASGLAAKDGIISPAYVVLAPKEGIDSKYASYLFKTKRLIYLFWAYSYGLTEDRLRLYYSDFAKIPVYVPTLEEQKRIAKILASWDKAIATTEKLLENSKIQKKALMQQLLTSQKRVPNFINKWQVKHLSELVNITMGSSPHSEAYNENQSGMLLIQGNTDIKNGKSAPRIYTSEITKVCKPGDVLLSVRAPVGTVARSVHNACIGRGVASLSSKESSSIDFIYHLLVFIEPSWKRLSQGSTFEAINGDDIKKLKVYVPASKKEQNVIAGILNAQDAQMANLMSQVMYLKEEKKSLMQQLIGFKQHVSVAKNPLHSKAQP